MRYGDNVMVSIHSGKDTRYLCSNVFLKVGNNGTRVTAGANATPQARSTFVLMRPGSHPGDVLSMTGVGKAAPRDEDVLLYGDRVVIACSPHLVADHSTGTVGIPLVLSSTKANVALGNTRKGMQEVVMTPARGADAEWVVVPASGDMLVGEGSAVRAGDGFELVHAMSNVPLAASLRDAYPTDFGAELEVHCASYKGTARSSMNQDGIMPTAAAKPENVWRFVYSSTVASEQPMNVPELAPLSPHSILAKARAMISRALGPHGVRSFALALSALDARGSGFLPRDAAKLALYDHGAALSEEEFSLLLAYFLSLTGAGMASPRSVQANLVPRRALLDAVRGEPSLSGYRLDVVREAFEYLCSTEGAPSPAATSRGSAAARGVSVSHAKAKFDGKWDPRVLAFKAPGAPRYGGMTAVEAKAEFGRQWPAHPKAGDVITLEQWVDYYADVAACFSDSEAEFGEYVFNSWHLPGRGSWKGKAGKKVHVDFFNGSSTDAVIPGGEDIHDDDFEGLVEALGRMGMGGIARVKVLGVVHQDE